MTVVVRSDRKVFTGYKPSPVDHRDVLYTAVAPSNVTTPPTFDIESQVKLPVYDQGQRPACVGWSSALLKSYQEFKECGTLWPFDGLAIYNLAGGGANGITMRSGLETLRKIGAPKSKEFFKIAAYAGVNPKNHDAVKHAIFTQGVLLGGFNVPRFFMQGGGKEFDAQPGGTATTIVGGHAIAIVGYDSLGLILHNSWGRSWGERGRAHVSWSFVDQYFDEVWTTVDLRDSAIKRKFTLAQRGALPS